MDAKCPTTDDSAVLVHILQEVKLAADSGSALVLGATAVHNLWQAINAIGCVNGHSMQLWGGIGATCRQCRRVEIDGEFYGFDFGKVKS